MANLLAELQQQPQQRKSVNLLSELNQTSQKATQDPISQLSPQELAQQQADIPTEANLAAEQARIDAIPARTLSETIEGLGEAALTTATGATGGALGFGAGALSGIIGELTGRLEPGKGLEEAQALAAKLTFEPRSEAGKEFVSDIGEIAGVLPPVLAGVAPGSLRGLNAPSKLKLSNSKSLLAKEIAEESTGQVKKSFEQKLTPSRKYSKQAGEAVKQGFDDGMVTVITNSSPIDKRRMLQMISKLEKGKGDPLFQSINRPADVAGESLLRKIRFLKSNNSQAGKQLNRVAAGLKGKEVDINEPVKSFFNDAAELGVKFDENLKPDFEGSQIETIAPAKKLIRDLSLRIRRNPEPDALDAHKFKRFIDENVTFGKVAKGLGGQTERIAKKLRAGVNETLGSQFDKYKEANFRYSETIDAIELLQKAAGSKVDFFGPNADKALGTVLRRLESNAQSRIPIMDAIKNAEIVAKKFGGAFDDDILTQVLFADELEAVFGGAARTSLKGQVKGANIESAIDLSQMSIPGAVAVGAKAGVRKLRGINEKNQLKSIKALLKASTPKTK